MHRNECLESPPPCRLNATCANTPGSFTCACSKGYYGNDLTKCAACAAGSYKSTVGAAACSLCLPGKYGPIVAAVIETVCLPCQLHSNSSQGSGNATQCLCSPGYTLANHSASDTLANHSVSDLNATAGNSSNSSETSSISNKLTRNCIACPSGKYKIIPGFSACLLCRAGKYSNTKEEANNESLCLSCPRFSTSFAGSYNRTSCQCIPGYQAQRREVFLQAVCEFILGLLELHIAKDTSLLRS